MNRITFLEYSKRILDKVSFNRRLFWKEYRKSVKILGSRDSTDLRAWLIINYLPERSREKTRAISQILDKG